jgi:hypothetical protein
MCLIIEHEHIHQLALLCYADLLIFRCFDISLDYLDQMDGDVRFAFYGVRRATEGSKI